MAETSEVEAKKKALLFLSGAREKMEEVRQEYEKAYSRLLSSLQYLKSEEERIEKECAKISVANVATRNNISRNKKRLRIGFS